MSKLQNVQVMEGAAFAGDWEKFKSFLADDVIFKVGNRWEARGPQGIADFLLDMLKNKLAINNLQIRGAWESEDTVILEFSMQGDRLLDKQKVAYPCIDVYRFNSAGKINDWKVYAIEPTFIS